MESFHNLEKSLFFDIFILAWKHLFLEQNRERCPCQPMEPRIIEVLEALEEAPMVARDLSNGHWWLKSVEMLEEKNKAFLLHFKRDVVLPMVCCTFECNHVKLGLLHLFVPLSDFNSFDE